MIGSQAILRGACPAPLAFLLFVGTFSFSSLVCAQEASPGGRVSTRTSWAPGRRRRRRTRVLVEGGRPHLVKLSISGFLSRVPVRVG